MLHKKRKFSLNRCVLLIYAVFIVGRFAVKIKEMLIINFLEKSLIAKLNNVTLRQKTVKIFVVIIIK